MNRSEIPTPKAPRAAPRPPSTAVNLGALVGVSRDDGPMPPAPLRPRVPTLQFYGAPVIRAKLPSISAPKAPTPLRVPAAPRASAKPAAPQARATAKPPLPPQARASAKPPLPPQARATAKPPLLPQARASAKPPLPRQEAHTPTEPLAALIAAELSRSDERIAAMEAELDIEPPTEPKLGFGGARAHAPIESTIDLSTSDLIEETTDARSDRPPPPSSRDLELPLARWRQRGTLVTIGAIAAGAALLAVNVGVAMCVADSIAPPPPHAAIAVIGIAVRASAPRPAPRVCETREARVVVKRALVSGGVEASVADGRVALGVATSPHEGRALEIDLASLATIGTARMTATQGLRRVVPLLPSGDVVDAAADADDRARTQLDAQRGAVVISPARIWKLVGAPVEGVRAAPLTSMKGYAVALRRSNAIWIGAIGGDDAQTPYAPLVRLSEAERRVGAPAVAVSGDAVIVAWAERSPDTAWRIKWARWRPGLAPESARDLVLPAGGLGEQAIAPSVAGLGDGRFVIAWTEGPASNHQVRAQLVGADDAQGESFAVSAPGVFAGQETIALGNDGRGVIAFFASRDGEMDVVAAPIMCRR